MSIAAGVRVHPVNPAQAVFFSVKRVARMRAYLLHEIIFP